MLDVNGQELREGGMAMLLCEVVKIAADHVAVRVLNSEMTLAVGAKQDEVLGLVADAELTAFAEISAPDPDDQADGVKLGAME
jgi:hypothetical protein